MKNVLVVSNYKAGRKKAVMQKKFLHKFLLKKSLNFKFISIEELECVNTKTSCNKKGIAAFNMTNKLASAQNDDLCEHALNEIDINTFDTFFAMGGDGTISKVVNIIMQNNPDNKTLAIIPCGTANLLAEKLGLSTNLKKTLKIINENHVKKIDLLNINGKYCILRCGFGFDADILCKTPQSLKNKFGYLAYFIVGIIFAFNLKSKIYNIEYNNKCLTIEGCCFIAANAANMYKNIVSVADNSKIDDGLIDFFILKNKNPFIFFCELFNIILGIHKNNANVTYFKSNKLYLKNDWTHCHIDGEKNNLKKNITINIIPKKINVFGI